MDAWKRTILGTAAYFLIPVYWQYSSSGYSDQAICWNFFLNWSQSSGWNFISFTYAFSDPPDFLITVVPVILVIALIVLVVFGYRSKSPQLALGIMITTFLILIDSSFYYFVTFIGGAVVIPTDIPILITMLVFSNQSRRSVVPTPGPIPDEIVKKCLKCGYANISTARFCLSCGAEIAPSGDGTRIY